MSYWADADAARIMISRGEVIEVNDGGGMQLMSVRGYADEVIKMAHRVQPFGFTSNPPLGSHGVVMSAGGRRDQAFIIGIENEAARQKGLKPGEQAIYDGEGQFLKMLNGRKTVISVGELTIVADKVVVESGDINLGGLGGKPVAVQGTVDSAGHQLVSAFCSTVKAV
ncbi:MAG: phage baseplate assembly protein V [Hyphomicrobiales bacterium]|nr:phage baseplate assembly protein V [Hyphomicrobiales bacterium]